MPDGPKPRNGYLSSLFVLAIACEAKWPKQSPATVASDVMTVESAGLRPLGFIDPTSMAVMQERGISMEGQFSKGLTL